MEQLQRLGELMVGATPAGGSSGVTRVRYVRAGDIGDGSLSPNFAHGPEPKRGRAARLAGGDVVVRARGVPAAAVVDGIGEEVYPTNDVLLFRADQTKIDPAYLAALLNLPTSRDVLNSGSQGAALSRLSVQALGNFEIPLPSLEIQRKIAAVADCMRAEQAILERLRELRRQLHDQILQQLLGNAHDEGGYPHRGLRQASRHASAGPSSPGSKEL